MIEFWRTPVKALAGSVRRRRSFVLRRPLEDAHIDRFQRIVRRGGAAGLAVAVRRGDPLGEERALIACPPGQPVGLWMISSMCIESV